MERNVKIVYLDDGKSKVIRGVLINEDDFSFTLRTTEGNMVIGKVALIKLTPEGVF